jgi:hypothetical protein
MQRQTWTRKLLNAVLQKRLPAGVLNANHLRRILDGNDREAVWAVEKDSHVESVTSRRGAPRRYLGIAVWSW